ncbi:hypothetical protein EC973_009195 [Apophysomyces ossiformis]|uniref:EF-hand domain-containing protein n=1 Tax=Apophysomyces ossiformis TaxID=679940 RepID=A0A8H7BS82_9FUNG|nr:hypothetical protein EC973_009195 [Apophysomyces ossiformis]
MALREDEKGLMDNPAPMPQDPFYTVDMEADTQAIPLKNQQHHFPDEDISAIKHASHDDDDDDDFDWNDDPDQPKPARRKTTRERIQAVMATPCCWHYLSPFMKRLLIALFGSAVFIAIAVCFYLLLPIPTEAEQNDVNFKNVRSNVQCWMYWAAFMWHIGWLTTVFIELVPKVVSLWTKIFKGRRSESVKSNMEYYMSLKWYLGLVLMASWNWGSWAFLLQYPFQSVAKQAYSQVIWNVFACIFVTTCLLFIQKTIIQIIATRFNRLAFDDRVRDNKEALKILDTLSKSEARRSKPEHGRLRNRRPPYRLVDGSEDSAVTLTDGRSTSVENVKQKGDVFSNFRKGIQNIVLTDKPDARSRVDKDKMDINSNEFAKKVARKLFYSLAYPNGLIPSGEEDKRSLTLQDFVPYFKSREEAAKAFSVFDKDKNGDLTRREFRDTVVMIYRERKALAQSMRDTSQALGKIDMILLIITVIAVVFISLAVFHVNIWLSLVPLGSFLLALTFVFGSSAETAFRSILFLFVTHPYDVGDYVIIDDQYLLVHNLGIMGTVFIRGDGQTVYAPTQVLMTKLISNVRRSGDMGENVVINVDFNTGTDQIYKLRDRLADWVASQSRDFAPGFDLRVQDIIDMNQLIINMWLPHKGNWQELGKRFQRKTRFMVMLKDTLSELGIKYYLPTQRFTQDRNDNFLGEVKETPQSFAQGTADNRRLRHRSFSNSASGIADGS